MIAPVHEQNAAERAFCLPEDVLIRLRGNLVRTEQRAAGLRFVPVGLDEVVFFPRSGHLLPLREKALCVDQMKDDRFEILAYGQD